MSAKRLIPEKELKACYGLLPAGLSLLAGASKAGKSWLYLWLCLQLARGGEIWGRTPPSHRLYCTSVWRTPTPASRGVCSA